MHWNNKSGDLQRTTSAGNSCGVFSAIISSYLREVGLSADAGQISGGGSSVQYDEKCKKENESVKDSSKKCESYREGRDRVCNPMDTQHSLTHTHKKTLFNAKTEDS